MSTKFVLIMTLCMAAACAMPEDDGEGVLLAQAASCATTKYDARNDFSHGVGADAGDGWNIFTNGSIWRDHAFSGESTIRVRARGERAGGAWPRMRVSVGGTNLGERVVSSAKFATYSFDTSGIRGSKRIRIEFLNDYVGGGNDRNLIVKHASLVCTGCQPTTYDARTDLRHSTGGDAGDGWNLWTNGRVWTEHSFAGERRVVVRARGDYAGGAWPRMRLVVAGQTIGEVNVNSSDYKNYAFTIPARTNNAELAVRFLNDYVSSDGDRNLYIATVKVTCDGGGGDGGGGDGGGGDGGGGDGGGVCPKIAELPRLRGVNLSGAEHASGNLPGCHDDQNGNCYYWPENREVDYWKEKGATMLRLPILWERLQPTAGGGFDAFNRDNLDRLVKRITDKGMYVLIDVHNYGSYRGNAVDSDAERRNFRDLWKRLANRYGDNCRVIFGLMNEPVSCGGNCTLRMMNAAIAGIRNDAGKSNPIFVTGLGYSGGHEWDNPWWDTRFGGPGETTASILDDGVQDPLDNFAIEVHQYVDDQHSGSNSSCSDDKSGRRNLTRPTEWAREHGYKLFLGEYASNANSACYDAANTMIDYTDANTDVWLGWTYWAGGSAWGCYADGSYDPQALVSPHCGPGGWGDRPSTNNVLERQGLR